MMERLLERIAISEYKENFILKGGLLIASVVGIASRTTLDMDITLKDIPLSFAHLQDIFTDLAAINLDDGMVFSLSEIEKIHELGDYPGFRISLDAHFGKTRQSLKVDVTVGDVVSPHAISYGYKLMFSEQFIDVRAYNIETILAEKLETVLSRSIANTRMRDFYDVYILTTNQRVDADILQDAIANTFKSRGSLNLLNSAAGIVSTIEKNTLMAERWLAFSRKYLFAQPVSWESVITALKELTAQILLS